jgi:hypothetical protein
MVMSPLSTSMAATQGYAAVWEIHDGKITRVKIFLDRADALRHAGLAD